ncbi:hypothetical protein L2E82_02267 [Cichorium intybus]|uniref:Uncharacterized protein n=1 Tax=Cichorium intybus TaxID=13427 RepID=A0ACB9H2S1_CICIN|nr:hypothetical protein L2E82_02267 [Cichorium intybus]
MSFRRWMIDARFRVFWGLRNIMKEKNRMCPTCNKKTLKISRITSLSNVQIQIHELVMQLVLNLSQIQR